MNNTTLNLEFSQKHIIDLLENLTIEYQNTQSERKNININFFVSESDFTLLEEIELLTLEIRGYASQIKARGYIEDQKTALEKLKKMRIFDISSIVQLYFKTPNQYKNIKSYLQMLDYLRLLILEYLNP